MKPTSLRSGTRRITHCSPVSSVAAMIGSTAFFAPLIFTSPCSGTPPLINRLSMQAHSFVHLAQQETFSRKRFSRNDDPRFAREIRNQILNRPVSFLEAALHLRLLTIAE